MKLSHFFIDHPRFAAVVNIFIMVFGLAAAAFLPVAQYPNIVPPTVQVTTGLTILLWLPLCGECRWRTECRGYATLELAPQRQFSIFN